MAGHNIITQKLIACLLTNNEPIDKEIGTAISFSVALKNLNAKELMNTVSLLNNTIYLFVMLATKVKQTSQCQIPMLTASLTLEENILSFCFLHRL